MEKWRALDSGYISKVAPIGFTDGLHVRCERQESKMALRSEA